MQCSKLVCACDYFRLMNVLTMLGIIFALIKNYIKLLFGQYVKQAQVKGSLTAKDLIRL